MSFIILIFISTTLVCKFGAKELFMFSNDYFVYLIVTSFSYWMLVNVLLALFYKPFSIVIAKILYMLLTVNSY